MRHRFIIAALCVLTASLPAAAQFYSEGNEPVGVKWWQIETEDFRVIYPEGLDSLARIYADKLERVKHPVAATAGFYPNEMYRRRLPVILHPWTADANGMVIWTPSRMELYTTPKFSAPQPLPWEEQLVIHESRHVSQMQLGNAPPFRPYGYVVGQMFAGALSSVYGEPAFLEGDAVAAETELTASGRGRNAAFLEYWRAAYREGEARDYWQWRYGSLYKYTPTYYTAGYVRAAGMRSVYGAQDFTAQYYSRVIRNKWWPWPLFNYDKTVMEVSGKHADAAFTEITDTLAARWWRDELARGPYAPSEQITPTAKHFIEYTSPCFLGDGLYAIREGKGNASEIVRIDPDGRVRHISSFTAPSLASSLDPSEALGRLYWSEIVRDPRWEMRSYSEIWYIGKDGGKHRLTHRTRWYNPSVSSDGKRIAVTEYPVEGGSSVIIIDALDGKEAARYPAPDGLQVSEAVWFGDDVIVCGVTSAGTGLYSVRGGYSLLLPCSHVTVKEMFEHEGQFYFTSDLTGEDELYRLKDGGAERVTNLPIGAQEYCFDKKGDLLFCDLSTGGRYLSRIRKEDLPVPVEADFNIPPSYPLARDLEAPRPVDRDSVIVIGEPRRYSRLAHAFRVHSWAPLYIDYDEVKALSFENITSAAGLGATAFFQNDLSTLQGSAAYNAFPEGGHWYHRGVAKIVYSGLYPKIETSFTVSSKPGNLYFIQQSYSNFTGRTDLVSSPLEGAPSFDASARIYLPLYFSSGGWFKGVIPQVQASVTSSVISHGALAPMNRVSASLRAYVIQRTPDACIYPHLGIGAEAGWSGRFGDRNLLVPNAYVYMYGYLPGILSTHGIRLTATVQAPVGEGLYNERYINVIPRGIHSSALATSMSRSPLQSKLTFDYAFPFLPLDWSFLCPVFYIRNLEGKIHADGSYFAGVKQPFLASVGASLTVVLGNFIWLPSDTHVGVQAFYNFGVPQGVKRYDIGFVFDIDL